MGGGAAEDIHVRAASDLLLREDDLHGLAVVGVGDGMALQGTGVG